MPGLYELQWEDARYAVSNAKYLDICITGVTDLATFHGRIYLDTIQASDIDQVLQDYDSSAGVVSNTDLNARSIVAANYADSTDVTTITTAITDQSAAIQAKQLAYARLSTRSDAGPTTDDATELTAINADAGAGGGDYSPAADSLEARADTVDDVNLVTVAGGGTITASGTGNQGYGE